ncbi:MAG: hypothetical protein AMK73_09815 [Planctomycetes bacterium SM23_32]|nr:MAG: hypothetical protein AMK73_09815 [Planctomycetes bacterium SM23_32]
MPLPAPAPPEASAVGLEPIAVELPRPMFEGTPRPLDEPNVEEPLGTLRPPFLAPEGTVNLAHRRPVSSSDPWPVIGELEAVTDGDKEATPGSFVELGPGTQWVQVDLDTTAVIYAIVVWHYHLQAHVYRDVVVQVAEDPDFTLGVTTVFNNDHDSSSGLGVGLDKGYVETFEGKLIDCKGVEGRYVRLYSQGNTSDDGNHYIEVEVYGQPVP